MYACQKPALKSLSFWCLLAQPGWLIAFSVLLGLGHMCWRINEEAIWAKNVLSRPWPPHLRTPGKKNLVRPSGIFYLELAGQGYLVSKRRLHWTHRANSGTGQDTGQRGRPIARPWLTLCLTKTSPRNFLPRSPKLIASKGKGRPRLSAR